MELSKSNWSRRNCLLIAPNWNWNFKGFERLWKAFELLIAPNWNWNLSALIKKCWEPHSFNRTKLELKFPWHWPAFLLTRLLIAPNWNWNLLKQIHLICYSLSFNRTKLELKSRVWCVFRLKEVAFNRTKLELKWGEL